MSNFARNNKLLRVAILGNIYEGLLALQKDLMVLVGWSIKYLVKPSVAKHETMHLQ